MQIVVLGAGRVGSALVAELVKENHDITVVDHNVELLRDIQAKYDVRAVHGNASHPDVLTKAKLAEADMLIAVTASDEVNMVACQIANSVFNTPQKIARIRSAIYTQHNVFDKSCFPIDVCINPENLVTRYIERLIQYPGAFQVLEFAGGELQLIGMRVDKAGPLTGKTLNSIYQHLHDVRMQVVAIYRLGRTIPVRKQTAIQDGDEIFFITSPQHVRDIINMFGRLHLPNKKILIAGGGNIGAKLARLIEQDYQVKIIESNKSIAAGLSAELRSTLILMGEAQDGDLLHAENIENTDVFCAVTDDDEVNVISSIQAKAMGARITMTLINRKSYIALFDKTHTDVVISPSRITIGGILSSIRHADIENIYSLRGGSAEALEVIAHGDEKSSKAIGKKVIDLDLPDGTIIGAIAREDTFIIANKDTVICSGDHCIIFVTDKSHIHKIEQLFQVNINYIE